MSTNSKPQTISARRCLSKPRTPFPSKAVTPNTSTLNAVTLSDWWLTQKNLLLCIEGFESINGSLARRLFTSAPIIKRHDSTNLTTADVFNICINGFINKTRSLTNGLSVRVCDKFLLGFPYSWEDYNNNNNNNDNNDDDDDDEKELSVVFDDVPVSRLQDLVMMKSNNVFDDVVESLRELTCVVNKTKESVENDDGKRLVSVGVKTRGMLRQREENEGGSVGERVYSKSKKKK